MDATMFNESDVTSSEPEDIFSSISGDVSSTDLTSSSMPSTSQTDISTADNMSNIPQLIARLFSSTAYKPGTHTQTELRSTQTVVLDSLENTDTSLLAEAETTSHNSVTSQEVSRFMTAEAESRSESYSSLHLALRDMSTPSTDTSSVSESNAFSIDTETVVPDFGSSAEFRSVPERSSSGGELLYSLNQHTTDVTGDWTTAMNDLVGDSSDSDVFQTQHVFNATTTLVSVNDTIADSDVLSHANTKLTTVGLSSFLQDSITTGQDAPSTALSNPSFTSSNTTIHSLAACDFFNFSVTNVTDFNPWPPGLYDVIMDEFDVKAGDVSPAVMAAKVTTLALLAIAGVVGNALVIWSVVKQRHLHRPPFYYLLSLSLTDLSRAAFCLPLVLMTILQGSVWRHGNSACDLFAFANSFFVLSSGVSLLDIAADRHLSLVYSRSYRRRSGGALNLVVVLLGWSLAFLVAFPPVVGVGAYAFEASEGQCTLRHKFYRHDNDTLGFLMVFTALMLVTLFLYYRIFLALRAHRKMRPLEHEPARSSTWTFVGPGANGQAFVNWINGFGGAHFGNAPNPARNPPRPNIARVVNLHVTRNQHVTRLFFLMTLSFNALWLPYQVLSYWRVFGTAEEINDGFVTAAAWLSYGQVAVCPLVYFSSRGPTRRRPSRADVSPQDKQEYLLESVSRKK